MTNLLVSLLAATVVLPTGQAESERAKLFTGLGDLHRKVTTDEPAAQIYFDQGEISLLAGGSEASSSDDEARCATVGKRFMKRVQ